MNNWYDQAGAVIVWGLQIAMTLNAVYTVLNSIYYYYMRKATQRAFIQYVYSFQYCREWWWRWRWFSKLYTSNINRVCQPCPYWVRLVLDIGSNGSVHTYIRYQNRCVIMLHRSENWPKAERIDCIQSQQLLRIRKWIGGPVKSIYYKVIVAVKLKMFVRIH